MTSQPNPGSPAATNAGAKALLQREVYRVTIRCKRSGNSLTTAENVKMAFPCPLCGDTLVYLNDQHKLGGHGKSERSLEHDLMKVEVSGTIGTR